MTDDAVATSNRSSIDLSIELERQLELDSLPGTPFFPTHAKDVDTRTSLDPHVLAHIVTQLRDSLTHITRERDDLVHQLAESHSREAEFKDSLALWAERCAALEKDLEGVRKKSQDDDEAISMLRSKGAQSSLLHTAMGSISFRVIYSGGEPTWPYETSKRTKCGE